MDHLEGFNVFESMFHLCTKFSGSLNFGAKGLIKRNFDEIPKTLVAIDGKKKLHIS